MRAFRLHRYGDRPVVDEVPEPIVTDPFDVLVRIGGAGVCRTDLHIIEGQFEAAMGPQLPYILGHENAGWVETTGSGVSHVAVGDAVIVHPLVTCGLCPSCRAGNDMHCESGAFPGVSTDGGMADLLKTTERSVVKLPNGVEPVDVAAHADAGLTAYHAVKKAVPLLVPGTRAVLIGAGGLGHIGIQVLRALASAQIISVDRSEEALALATKVGAHHAVLAQGRQVDDVLALTDGKGADVVIDFVGEGGTESDAIRMLRGGGTYFVVGYGGALNVPTIEMILREINIVGNLVGTYNELGELMTLASRGLVELHTQTYPLEAAPDAIGDLDAGRVRGRGILVP